MPSTRLLHLRLKSPTSYFHASQIQNKLLRLHLDAKKYVAKAGEGRGSADEVAPQSTNHDAAQRFRPGAGRQPPPLFLTAQFDPIYTLGRRDLLKLRQEESLPAPVHYSNRGGQITFHGPGQCVGYLITDLRRHSIQTRDFVHLLESTAISTLASHGLKSFTTSEPGVWVAEDRKIASVGVALRRFISTHGIAVNMSTDLSYFDSITACGLEGVKTTSMLEEGHPADVEVVATEMAQTLAQELKDVDGVREISEKEVSTWWAEPEDV